MFFNYYSWKKIRTEIYTYELNKKNKVSLRGCIVQVFINVHLWSIPDIR